MPCHPMLCTHAEDCRDLHCPGHPKGDIAKFDTLHTRFDPPISTPEDFMSDTAFFSCVALGVIFFAGLLYAAFV